MSPILRKFFPHLGALALFLALTFVYFLPQLEGKIVVQGDVIQYKGMTAEVERYYKETGEKPLWTNAMFGGMPTYQINTPFNGNYLLYFDRLMRLGFEPPIGRFFLAMAGFYVMMMVLGVHSWLSILGAIAFGLTTNNFLLYEAGHETKLRAISFLPLVAAGMLLTFRKKYLWGGVLFALGLGLNIMANHVQMTYYFALTLPFFGVAQLIHDIRTKELPHFLKATGMLILGALLAAGASFNNLYVTYLYSKDTMRGEPILQQDQQSTPGSSSETEGLAWDYAMQWSNGGIDLFASLIPGAAGGGSGEKVGPSSAIYKDLSRKGARLPAELNAPLYWGDLPFTSGPIYFGAAVFFFFLLGLLLVKGPVKWWLGLGALLTFLLSMGKNLEPVSAFFYHYFPLYNKFRTPNSILTIASFLFPLLGFLGLQEIVSEKSDPKIRLRSLYIAGGISSAICLFFWLLGPSFFDFSNAEDARYQQMGFDLKAIISDRKALLQRDSFRSLLIILISAGLIWAYIQKKIQLNLLIIGLSIVTLFDLWTVGRRYLNNENFESTRTLEANLQPRQADQQIMQDPALSFRVFDLSESTFQSSKASNFHQSIGGYHAAKLQRYQDIIDRHLSKGNQKVVDMLNTKYFIMGDEQGQAIAQQNPGALGNAWFVSQTRMVNSPNEEINALNDFDPAEEAVIHREFSDYLNGLSLQKEGTITLIDYKPEHLTYQSNSSGERLAVFSEVWYGPNKGWQAYIDGQPVDHIRANYLLRAMRIPAGSHKIEFVFSPKSFQTGKLISRIISGLMLLGFLGFTGYKSYWALKNLPKEPVKHKPATPAATHKSEKRTLPVKGKKKGKKR